MPHYEGEPDETGAANRLAGAASPSQISRHPAAPGPRDDRAVIAAAFCYYWSAARPSRVFTRSTRSPGRTARGASTPTPLAATPERAGGPRRGVVARLSEEEGVSDRMSARLTPATGRRQQRHRPGDARVRCGLHRGRRHGRAGAHHLRPRPQSSSVARPPSSSTPGSRPTATSASSRLSSPSSRPRPAPLAHGACIIVINVLSFAAAMGISAIVFNHVFGFPSGDPTTVLYSSSSSSPSHRLLIFLMTAPARVRGARLPPRVLRACRSPAASSPARIVLATTFSALSSSAALPRPDRVHRRLRRPLDTLIIRSLLVPAVAVDMGRGSGGRHGCGDGTRRSARLPRARINRTDEVCGTTFPPPA